MAKKSKEHVPNANSIPNKDIIQRLNFLYQASTYLNGLAPELSVKSPSHAGQNSETQPLINAVNGGRGLDTDAPKPNKRRKASAGDLARSYVKTMKVIGQKTNVRMDPSVKRTLCKGCNTVLMPGITTRVRVKPLSSHGHAVLVTCLHCHGARRLPAPPILQEDSEQSTDMNTLAIDDKASKETLDARQEDTETTPADGSSAQHSKSQKSKKRMQRRPVPFFEREGHILFVGNEVADTSQASE